METIVIVVHMLAALAIIGLIMLQQGKGAEMGASFGAGASQTLFGGRGSGNFLSRSTAVIATIFFVTSFGLAVIAKQKATVDDNMGFSVPVDEIPANPAEQPVGDVPVIDNSATDEGAVSEVPTVEAESDTTQEPVTDVPQPEDVPAENSN